MFSFQSNLIRGVLISEMKLIKFLLILLVSLNVIDLNFGETREEVEKWEEYKVVNLIIMVNSKKKIKTIIFQC